MKKLLLLILTAFFFISNQMNAQTRLWGTQNNGNNFLGNVFSTDIDGNDYNLEYTFTDDFSNSVYKTVLCEADNGKFYGMTYAGGINNLPMIYEYDITTETYNVVFNFSDTINGVWASASLLKADNGKLYGTTAIGGANNRGTLFEFDPTNHSFTKKLDFDGTNGDFPFSSLIQTTNGKLYGVTENGGTSNWGVLFEYDINTNSLTKKYDFSSASSENPSSDLFEASNGKLYGTTNGFSSGIFEYDINLDTLIMKHTFTSGGASNLFSNFVEDSNGNLLSTSSGGGTNSLGYLYSYNINTELFQVIHDFETTTGGNPQSNILMSNNKIYGLTRVGGQYDEGVLFEYDINADNYNVKRAFDYNYNSKYPQGGLLKASNGLFYGTTAPRTQIGFGPSSKVLSGVIFEYDISFNNLTNKHTFSTNGGTPLGELVYLESTNKIYGVSGTGGIIGYDDYQMQEESYGTIYEIDPVTKVRTKLLNFTDEIGKWHSGLIDIGNNKLLGVSTAGGANENGSIYEYDVITNSVSKKLDLNFVNSQFFGGVFAQVSDNIFYGMTSYGGVNNWGAIYEYDLLNNTLTNTYDFDGTNGSQPNGDLLLASNGKLYGITKTGGANGKGTLFEYDYINANITKKIDFDNDNFGYEPIVGLTETTEGKLLGVNTKGGANSDGAMFEYDIATNSLIEKISFNETTLGKLPTSGFLQTSLGNIIGTTINGGDNSNGTIFNYDLVSSQAMKTHNFVDASYPVYQSPALIEVNSCVSSFENVTVIMEEDYTSPSGNYTWTESGIYQDTLFNANTCGGDSIINIDLTIEKVDGISNTAFNKLSYMPNPTDGHLVIDLGEIKQNVSITIVNVQGQKQYSKVYSESQNVNLNIDGAQGIYFIKIQSDDGQRILKVLKK